MTKTYCLILLVLAILIAAVAITAMLVGEIETAQGTLGGGAMFLFISAFFLPIFLDFTRSDR